MNTRIYTSIVLTAIIAFSIAGTVHGPSAEDLVAPGMINFKGLNVSQAIEVYRELTRANLFVDSRAKQSRAQIVCKNDKPLTKAECAKFIEKALLEQAGIVITKLDSNRVSICFNDALPVKPVEVKK